MTTTAAARRAPPRTTPIGSGHLHQALEDARDLDALRSFCAATGCQAAEVSDDGKRLSILLVLSVMRKRGYIISEPARPQEQRRKGHTAWLVNVTAPSGPTFKLAFFTPDAP